MNISEANVEVVIAAAKSAAENNDWDTFKDILANAFTIERGEERKGCAKIARAVAEKWDARGDGLNALPACEEIKAAIRARGEKT